MRWSEAVMSSGRSDKVMVQNIHTFQTTLQVTLQSAYAVDDFCFNRNNGSGSHPHQT